VQPILGRTKEYEALQGWIEDRINGFDLLAMKMRFVAVGM